MKKKMKMFMTIRIIAIGIVSIVGCIEPDSGPAGIAHSEYKEAEISTLTPTPTPIPTLSLTSTPTLGFDFLFAITGILAAIYLIKRRE